MSTPIVECRLLPLVEQHAHAEVPLPLSSEMDEITARWQRDGSEMAARWARQQRDGSEMAARWRREGRKTAEMAARWPRDGKKPH